MVKDVELYYYTIGQGSPLVLIHGWCADGLSHLFQLPLSYNYRLILPDLRGFGKSSKPQTECTTEILASDVNGLLETLGMKKAGVYGCTFGGMVALQFALDYPEMVEALILVNTASTSSGLRQFFDDFISLLNAPNAVEALIEMMSSALSGFDEAFAKSPAGLMFIEAWLERLEHIEPKALIELAKGIKKFEVTQRLSEISVPTLIVAGEKDPVFPPSYSEEMHKRIAGSEYVIIDAGHGTPFLRPDEFNKVVRNFLNKIGH